MFTVGATIKLEVFHTTSELLDPSSLLPQMVKTSVFDFTDGIPLSMFGKQ